MYNLGKIFEKYYNSYIQKIQKMSDLEQRSYIKVRTAKKDSAVAIHKDLVDTYGEAALPYSTVARWSSSFKAGRQSVEDRFRSGRPVTEINKTNIQLVEKLIEKDCHITYASLKEQTSLSMGTLHRIVLHHLKFRKITSRWVPYKLSAENKKKRVDFAKAMLQKINNEEWRLDQILTGDECWIYHRSIKKRRSTRAWKRKGQTPEIIVRRGRSEPKTMFVIFFRSTGPVYIHSVERGKTIDQNYYINNCLSPMIENLKKQRPSSGTKGIKILHDNATPHTHEATVTFIQSNGMQIIDHPPYSPDLAPCDFWLFDYIKQRLGDHKDEKSLAESVTKIVEEIPHSEFLKTFRKYIERLKYCVRAKGDYFEHCMK
jgi:histone-lysine N-methyltransferase SETMAR